MKAMILAAGLGTRLRPLTDERPKALAEVGGRTLLEITLRRLNSFGISDVIVNVHHFADMVVEYLKAKNNFGMRIEISREENLLDTGGGLQKAADFFLRDGADEPFVLHNVDVLSAIDLTKMAEFHEACGALVTLAVQRRKSSRYLLFDDDGSGLRLCGRRTAGREDEMVCAATQAQAWAFAGIHVISPRIFERGFGDGYAATDAAPVADAGCAATHAAPAAGAGLAFPIIPEYLRLAGAGEEIAGFRADEYYWRDLGTAESLRQAAEDLAGNVVQQ